MILLWWVQFRWVQSVCPCISIKSVSLSVCSFISSIYLFLSTSLNAMVSSLFRPQSLFLSLFVFVSLTFSISLLPTISLSLSVSLSISHSLPLSLLLCLCLSLLYLILSPSVSLYLTLSLSLSLSFFLCFSNTFSSFSFLYSSVFAAPWKDTYAHYVFQRVGWRHDVWRYRRSESECPQSSWGESPHCLSIYLSVCLSIWLSIHSSVHLSIYLFDCLSLCLPVY